MKVTPLHAGEQNIRTFLFWDLTYLLSQVFISLSLQIAVSTLGALNENPLQSRTGKAARPRWTARVSRGCRLHPRCSRCPRDSPPDLPQRSLRIRALRRRRPPPCRTARHRWPRSFWPRTTPEPAHLKTAETRCTLRPRRPRDGGTAEAHSRPRLDNAGSRWECRERRPPRTSQAWTRRPGIRRAFPIPRCRPEACRCAAPCATSASRTHISSSARPCRRTSSVSRVLARASNSRGRLERFTARVARNARLLDPTYPGRSCRAK